ncbi:MAG: acetyl-CoA carboxylase, biotin carboxyl carrier protein [Omnitrophica bacterium RIFCSPLOWO2_02_FULL_45_16]|nr:MAG: acetyl-CoA carboxylase, biotin carboxyl carrier protein [Omnitrophica bacterium RIFCSPHIGHO2_02_FULL_46_20]OGW93747.1 MAG: acetyl-CoA carboxylase, biotin carboxyl carrier protein [Omnitrophica bacterium RIFCSPLOWO2_01_FULL_45_24]OGX00847.1 MAG: acetyl-CoA carboxylase, biotin carboxyl carrier protein [Omnitrophica bacterium RIFCSPLOWO2_02_FULL_45_16]
MYIKEIKDMINLMNENGLAELEIEKDGMRIRLKKSLSGFEKAVEFAPQPAAPQHAQEAKSADKIEKKNTIEIKAPMVGTFYRSPSPEMLPYVNIGDHIDIGQVLCVIEAMKLMNEIKSEIKGRIIDIHTENAEPVEFGQVLFVIETS